MSASHADRQRIVELEHEAADARAYINLLHAERRAFGDREREQLLAWLGTMEALRLTHYQAEDGSVSFGLARLVDAIREGRHLEHSTEEDSDGPR